MLFLNFMFKIIIYIMRFNRIKKSKRSLYYGVFKCNNINKFYFKVKSNKKCFKSSIFNNEINAAKNYDNYLLENNIKKKLNFPKKINTKNNMCIIKKNIKIRILKKNNMIRKRVPEYMKLMSYELQENNCALCKKSLKIDRIVDHIIHRKFGGPDNTINNYQTLCSLCNKWKTYNFDHYLKDYLSKKKNIFINEILDVQKKKYSIFFEQFKFNLNDTN